MVKRPGGWPFGVGRGMVRSGVAGESRIWFEDDIEISGIARDGNCLAAAS